MSDVKHTYRRERELREPVHAWLSPTGETKVFYEYSMDGKCDMVGVLFASRNGRAIPEVLRATAIELKLLDIAGVIQQARMHRCYVHASYAAMPEARCRQMVRASRAKFRDAGVGLLSVGLDAPPQNICRGFCWYYIRGGLRVCVKEIIKPGPPFPGLDTERFRKRWWALALRHERLRRQAAELVEP